MIYSQIIHWTEFDGSHHEVIFDGCRTRAKAIQEAVNFARRLGWPGNPRWWEFWRRHDTRVKMPHRTL